MRTTLDLQVTRQERPTKLISTLRSRLCQVALLVALAALSTAACGGESQTSPASPSPPGVTPSPTSLEATPSPALSRWSPDKLRAALPGWLVARPRRPRLELVSPDGTTATTLWTPPRRYGFEVVDCDPRQGRTLVHLWNRRVLWDEGRLALLAEDGTATWLDLPEKHHSTGAALLADGSILCASTLDELEFDCELLWSDGHRPWQRVQVAGRLLRKAEENGIDGLEPMAGRRTVLVKTWAWGGALLPAVWSNGTLKASGKPVKTDWLSGAPLSDGRSVVMACVDESEPELTVDLVEVRWVDGTPQRRVIVKDGPQSSGHDSITLVATGPNGSVLVLGWRLDDESASGDGDDSRVRRWQRLDLDTGQFTALPSGVRGPWPWLER